ncbi:hypothetical protein B0A49_10944 [Cryomyces minteri]|uniref:Translation initiation factor eIF2B subunit delta n=1 Tax=Cryomyces minteri TaxID=331657 RepID=A0A4U0WGN9_9PEZI|nr:hypothetical protein B0A49_10944 [Cryomyces minteri]
MAQSQTLQNGASSRSETQQADTATQGTPSRSNGINQQANSKPGQRDAPSRDDSATNTEHKLSGAELKKKQKAEKAARRAQAKAGEPEAGPGGGNATLNAQGQGEGPKKSKQSQQEQRAQGKPGQDSRIQHKSSGSTASSAPRPVALRRRPSQSGGASKEPKKSDKEVGLFRHLYGQPRRYSIEGASKEVHPAVLALGLQMSSYVVCGSNARCVAMLLAFKSAILAYTTPPSTSLARHLTSHYLSPQIEYLKSCRPISISMGNAIRWLKDYIIKIDPSVPDSEAKASICSTIDTFIRERITVADTAIAATASSKIRDGDVVLTYAKSSIVQQTLLTAHAAGTRFRVIVVDSKPLFEGKNLARHLAHSGLNVTYSLVSAAAHAVRDATKVFLGAHAMMSNGRLYSRVGTAIVAMLAHERDIPVIVCCESLKFTDRVALDSIVTNEVAPPDELLLSAEPAMAPGQSSQAGHASIARWKDVPNLQLLNVLYDVTPAEYIKMVVTEYGSLPPSSVPVVHRISTERDVRV